MNTVHSNRPVAEEVVAKALVNTKNELALSNEVVGNIIGVNASTMSRIVKNGQIKNAKTLEASLLLIRVYRSLYAILGGSRESMRHWLTTQNAHLNGMPILQLQEMVGLVNVVQYLDAMRGRA
ncbi:hypothetical protein MNBD_GAMMA04-429 [hydrothermal vent metagenome]|uniref:Antitoxin Xre/MbcA/ParS-like toxin-binding domain-containing protein n=1 Tax=hydrothermal vent metagenome TaxID=652676 RepID=A0A3B0WYS1_9ZZZZ